MSGFRSGLGWLVLGLAVGGIAGLLFAPRPGKETRATLAKRLEHMREQYRERQMDQVHQMEHEAATR